MKDLSDAELISLIKKSNPQAFDELHHRFWHPLYTIAYKKIADREETGDLLQELFIELWEKRETPTLEFTNATGNWLRNRLWYKVAIYFRTKGFKKKHEESFAAFLKNEEESMLPLNSLELKEADTYYEEILNTLNNCIEDMPARMKEIFLLRKSENRSVKEIAAQLNISPKTVKVQLERATIKLRKAAELHHPSATEILFVLWLINC